ncbi:MAG: response regulator [Pseudomonadota bacterium]
MVALKNSASEGRGASRILLVDDEPLVAKLHARALVAVGYDVCFAENGADALEAIIASPPDLVLSDINMPMLDGFALTEALIGRGLKTMPVLFLTADDRIDVLTRAIEAGADDMIVKGASFQAILFRAQFWLTSSFATLPNLARQAFSADLKIAGTLPKEPVMGLFGNADLFLSRAHVAFADALASCPPGFGGEEADRIRILGFVNQLLATLARVVPIAHIRRADHIEALLHQLSPTIAYSEFAPLLAKFDEIAESMTFRNSADRLSI